MKAPSLNGTRKNLETQDASRKLPTSKSTVNNDTTRSSTAVAATPGGPRVA